LENPERFNTIVSRFLNDMNAHKYAPKKKSNYFLVGAIGAILVALLGVAFFKTRSSAAS